MPPIAPIPIPRDSHMIASHSDSPCIGTGGKSSHLLEFENTGTKCTDYHYHYYYYYYYYYYFTSTSPSSLPTPDSSIAFYASAAALMAMVAERYMYQVCRFLRSV